DLAQKSVPENIIKVNQDKRYRFLDKDAELSIATKSLPSNLTLESMKERMRFSTRGWTVPYRYRILPDNNPVRPDMFIELRRTPAIMTSDSSFHFLFRSSPGVTRINEHVLDAYPNTGIFFTEIPFHSYGRGTRVRGSVSRDGETLFYENIYYGNMPDTTTKHAVILNSVSPQGSVLLPPDDVLRITFESHLADQMDTILLYANGNPLPLWYNGNRYVGNISCASYQNVDSVYIQVAARDKRGEKYSYNLPVSLKVRKPQHFPVIETKEDFIPVSYSLGVVRLGGPYINEFPKGVRFVTDGKFGPNYRIRLNKNETAYVHERHVKVLPAGMPAPQYYISSMNVYVDSTSEVVTIPWPEPVPYAMTPQPEQKRIRIRLYGVQSISTWLSHREGLKIIDYVTWEQNDAETYDVYIQLKTDNIWGYELIQRNRHLEFRVKYPPKKKDMLIAIEAGHGGDWNWGAVGLSGLLEKDVNRDTAEKLRDMLRKKGYKVVEIRPEDTAPSLRDRWLLTDSLKADVFISIHANAAGGHYLRVGGTSTYYNDPFWRDFAELTYGKLRELPLEEFGIVGSFNYMMCRMPQRPSILVELAFMSHAEDENKMADPAFRATMAEKIAEAVHAYIEQKLRSAVK
ncbi:MAG: N-acetylmuramoyl-L-alanine amidase, partial [FCB group bacterium]|nr:N-acetylmuramoyl-L-alanine amidase [FCB group bacterium]